MTFNVSLHIETDIQIRIRKENPMIFTNSALTVSIRDRRGALNIFEGFEYTHNKAEA